MASSVPLQWNEDDDIFLYLHMLHGMPRKDTIRHYIRALPHKSAPQIYGRWSFWKSWLPEESAQEDIYDIIRKVPRATSKKRKKREGEDRVDLSPSSSNSPYSHLTSTVSPSRSISPKSSKQSPKQSPSPSPLDIIEGRTITGPFTQTEDVLYLELLKTHGKPILKNPQSLKVFCDSFPRRIIRSIQSHVGAFVYTETGEWTFKPGVVNHVINLHPPTSLSNGLISPTSPVVKRIKRGVSGNDDGEEEEEEEDVTSYDYGSVE
jgi:hypothetical protein